MRHATAGQAAADFERPLTAYGISQAATAATELQRILTPSHFIVSPARRTRMTASTVCEVMSFPESKIKFDERIYEASTQALLYLLTELPGSCDDVLLIGHNPAIAYLAPTLCSESYLSFPPGTFCVFECESWGVKDLRGSTLRQHFSPS